MQCDERHEEEQEQEQLEEGQLEENVASSLENEDYKMPGGQENAGVTRESFVSRNWYSAPCEGSPTRRQQPCPPGPTAYVVSNAQDILSMFYLFLTPEMDKIILEETNREGLRRYRRERWRGMDEVDLHAYVGLLILAGVYRSRGEATASLWDAECGRAIFHTTMSHKLFHVYSTLVRFDDHELRSERHAADKLAAVRKQ